ncbi:STAS-like domain-containing protein [Bdellovibrio sp. KM01]|uniref:STAS-like domain-containing protein n=1 Tax=Bdellovibrio sp. KM01 TaxID=2748865 RepID=UPI0015E95E34|nr:STAS-like domain-containing protein [Bdellovibrio sp. KM01]QLY25701.1 STAS-like domain-containing protein [Bdellovibrio sp. KM01]
MSTQLKINVYEIVGGDSAIAVEDGEALFSRIKNAISNGVDTEVNFANVNLIVSSFLNAGIGQLYGEFDEILLKSKLKVTGLSEDDQELLVKVIKRAKEYFAKKETFNKVIKENLGDDT